MTMFNEIPTDVIIRIGKFLDYQSTINWNRTLNPTDRIVHRRFTQEEVTLHDAHVWRKTLTTKIDFIASFVRENDPWFRKKCKHMMDLFCMFKANHRAFVLLKNSQVLHNGVVNKCVSILDSKTGIIQAACKTDKKRLKKIARRVLDDALGITPIHVDPKLIKVIKVLPAP